MSDNPVNSSNENIPEEWRYKPDLNLYRAYLSYLEEQGLEDWHSMPTVAFIMADGTYRFSSTNPLEISEKIAIESVFSDRVFVIVTVAYLEDQLRILLTKYLADDEITYGLLDPNQSSLASLVPMANLAYSMGLLAKEWLEILKRMARLRNLFAHVPAARYFSDLDSIDPKSKGVIHSLIERSKQYGILETDEEQNFKKTYYQLFLLMYNLTQFAIEHIAIPQSRQPFDGRLIVKIMTFIGFSKQGIKEVIDSSEKEE